MSSFDYADFSASFPWFFPLCACVFGAVVGSFLNVVIHRVPAGKSVVTPGSHCACGQPIAWYDNIPILSWLILRGRARCCGRHFSIRYPAIEALTGLLFLACWLHFPPAKAVCGMLFMAMLVCATFIDLDHMIIPDVFTIGGGVVGVALAVLAPELHGLASHDFPVSHLQSLVASLQGLLVGSGLVLWILLISEAVLKKEAMGFGDVKFVGMIGAFTGWQGTVTAVFGGAIVGTVWFIFAKLVELLRGRRAAAAGGGIAADDALARASGRMEAALSAEHALVEEYEAHRLAFGARVPFGPMLAVAAALHFLFVHRYVAEYFAQFAELLR